MTPSPNTLRSHPRLLTNDLTQIATLVAGDARARTWYQAHEREAQRLLGEPVCGYVMPDGKRLVATSREVMRRTYALALAHHVSGREDYVDRLWSELAAAARFPDWNPRHFLDVGEMAHGFAIGYDWLHGRWDASQRELLELALIESALLPGLQAHADPEDPNHWWTVGATNWNLVCNGGLLMAALAIGDVHGELAQQVVEATMTSMARAAAVYAPDGAFPEGQAYWSYGTQYLVLAAASFTTATGRRDPLTSHIGIDSTVRFPIHLNGPLGRSFNYYDGTGHPSRPSGVFWLAERFDDPVAAWWAALGADELSVDHQQLPTSLLWYRPGRGTDPLCAGEPLDAHFRGSEVVTMRSAWGQRGAVWLAGKAGDNSSSHGDLDLGTFVLDALGTRWLHDPGSDDYNLPGYFDVAGGRRWDLYRKRAEGHNTLVVDPDVGGGQSCSATHGEPADLGAGVVVMRGSSATEAYAVVDLSRAHIRYRSWLRGWRLFDFRRQVLVQDEVELVAPGTIWSFFHTAARIRIAPDGRSAVLSDGPSRLLLRVLGEAEGDLVEMDAAPLWTSPRPEGQAENSGMRKLALRLAGTGPVKIAIQITPMSSHEPVPPASDVTPLAQWSAPREPVAQLKALQVDGLDVGGFAPDVWTYELPRAGIGDIAATPAPGGRVSEVREPGGDVVLDVHMPGAKSGRYRLRRRPDDSPQAMTSPTFASSDDGNVAANAFDVESDAFWRPASAGSEWIGCDLGGDGDVAGVRIAWREGNRSRVGFDIEVASESASWSCVWKGHSSGTTTRPQSFGWPTVRGRYVRLIRRDSGPAAAFAITSVEVPGRAPVTRMELGATDLRMKVPPLFVGSSCRVEVVLKGTSGGAVPATDYSVELFSSDRDVVDVDPAGGNLIGRAEGIADVTAVVVTATRRLVHRSVKVHVGVTSAADAPGAVIDWTRGFRSPTGEPMI